MAADEAIYAQLKELADSEPDLRLPSHDRSRWLGRLYEAVQASGADNLEVIQLKLACDGLDGILIDRKILEVRNALYRALAKVERHLPEQAQGGFIAAGDVYDALVTLGAVLDKAQQRVLIVDPFMAAVALDRYARMAPERVSIDLLGGEKNTKFDLKPAAEAWIQQHGGTRPLRVRVTDDQLLHDRLLFVDDREAWDISQSLNKLAARSPATIARSMKEQAKMKIAAYGPIFDQAQSLI